MAQAEWNTHNLTHYERVSIIFLDHGNTFDGLVIAGGRSLMGDKTPFNHVVLMHRDMLFELTWEGLDVNSLPLGARLTLVEDSHATVLLDVPSSVWNRYLKSLTVLVRSRTTLWDYLRILIGRKPVNPVCTALILQLLEMKHDAELLPKNLFGLFVKQASLGKNFDNGTRIIEIDKHYGEQE